MRRLERTSSCWDLLHSSSSRDGCLYRIALRPFRQASCDSGILSGIKPVVIAVILQALWSLGRAAVKTTFLAFVGFASLLLSLVGLHPLLLLLLAGVAACASRKGKRQITRG